MKLNQIIFQSKSPSIKNYTISPAVKQAIQQSAKESKNKVS